MRSFKNLPNFSTSKFMLYLDNDVIWYLPTGDVVKKTLSKPDNALRP